MFSCLAWESTTSPHLQSFPISFRFILFSSHQFWEASFPSIGQYIPVFYVSSPLFSFSFTLVSISILFFIARVLSPTFPISQAFCNGIISVSFWLCLSISFALFSSDIPPHDCWDRSHWRLYSFLWFPSISSFSTTNLATIPQFCIFIQSPHAAFSFALSRQAFYYFTLLLWAFFGAESYALNSFPLIFSFSPIALSIAFAPTPIVFSFLLQAPYSFFFLLISSFWLRVLLFHGPSFVKITRATFSITLPYSFESNPSPLHCLGNFAYFYWSENSNSVIERQSFSFWHGSHLSCPLQLWFGFPWSLHLNSLHVHRFKFIQFWWRYWSIALRYFLELQLGYCIFFSLSYF